MFLSLVFILVTFTTPMNIFLHYITLMEVYVRFNPGFFYPLALFVWLRTLWAVFVGYRDQRLEGRYWVVHRQFLDQYDGYEDASTKDLEPVIVKEIDDENDSDD